MGDQPHLMSVREPLALDLVESEICVFCAGSVNGNKEVVSTPALQAAQSCTERQWRLG